MLFAGALVSFWRLLEFSMSFFALCALIYLSVRFACFRFLNRFFKHKFAKFIVGIVCFSWLFVLLLFLIGFMNAVICLFYLTCIWIVCDIVFWGMQKVCKCAFQAYFAGGAAIVLSLLYLANGWYQAHHVSETSYQLYSDKLSSSLRIVLFADAHIGTTFSGAELSQYVQQIQKHNPDMVLIVGDLVDNDTSKQNFLDALDALSRLKTTYGTFFVLGNHDISSNGEAFRGFSNQELVAEIQKHGILVLQDEAILIDDKFYLIGRKDAYESRRGRDRKPISFLLQNLDKSKYVLVMNHQPNDYANEQAAGVDLVVSGHTHGGQLFPFNYVSLWAGLNDKIYGHEKLGQTDFIVTSGISDWRVKFKTGCKSEFVVIDVDKQSF